MFGIRSNVIAFGSVVTRLTGKRSASHTITMGGKEIPLGIPDNVSAPISLPKSPAICTSS